MASLVHERPSALSLPLHALSSFVLAYKDKQKIVLMCVSMYTVLTAFQEKGGKESEGLL